MTIAEVKEQLKILLINVPKGLYKIYGCDAEALERAINIFEHLPEVINCPHCGRMYSINKGHECSKERASE